MRKFSTMLFAAAMAVVVVSGATAQDEKKKGNRPGQFQRGGAGGMMGGGNSVFTMIGTNKVLQDELKVTDDQKTKLEEVGKAAREKISEAMKDVNFREMSEEQRKELTEKMTKLRDESKTAVEGVLTAEQKKRANEINYQMMGTRAFANKDVQAALKMTEEQVEKVKDINEASQKDLRELMQAGGFGRGRGGDQSEEDRKKMEDNRKKMEALRKDAEEKIVAVMTDDQKKQWKEMVGEKFDTSKLQQGGTRRQRDN